MEWRGRLIVGYRKEAGKKEVVSFYDGETQIGQLTKPNAVVNNCDCYLLHFLDNSLDREIVAFFTVYYDFLYHNHSGELMRGRRTDVEYTFDRYNKMFNKNFIAITSARKKTSVWSSSSRTPTNQGKRNNSALENALCI